MLRNTTIGIAVALTLLLGVGVAAGAINRDRPITRPTTLSYGLKNTASAYNDVDPPGTGIGDQLTSHNLLMKDGKAVGHLGAVCTDTGSQLVCTALMWVPGGQIALTGQLLFRVLNDGGSAHLAITGGTGAYRHAHGQATIEDLGAGPTSRLVLSLTP